MIRVFYLKTMNLLLQLKKKQIFNRYLNCVWIIKYQKRELPHMHLLLFLHSKDRFLNVARVDEIVFVEFLVSKLNFIKEFTNVVQFVMTHGFCDIHNFTILYINKNVNENFVICSKRYSRSFTNETLML